MHCHWCDFDLRQFFLELSSYQAAPGAFELHLQAFESSRLPT